jgi:hypothetical protein
MERGRIHSFQFDNNEAGILEYGLLARAHLLWLCRDKPILTSGLEMTRTAYIPIEQNCSAADRWVPFSVFICPFLIICIYMNTSRLRARG